MLPIHLSIIVVIATVTSWCHLCCRIVMVLLLPSRCRLHRRIVMVSSSQSCCCGAFTVALSRFRHRRCGVAFASVMVSLSPLRCCLCIGCSFVVAVTVLPSSSHCHSFIIVVVLPSLSHCCGVVVTVSSLPLWCCLHRRIVAVLSSQSHCCGAFAVALLWFRRHRCSVTLSSSQFCCRCRSVVIAVLLSPSWCRFCCHIVVASWCHRCSHVVASLWSLLLHCGHCC